MENSLKNIFAVPDLRKRVLFTLGMLGVYRVGSHIPTPGVNTAALAELAEQAQNTIFGIFDMFSGGNLSKVTIFALGIMPYISASIILQLLTVVWPYLEKLSKEGELGRRKITQYTRYGTIVLSVVQALGIAFCLEHQTGRRRPRRSSTTRAGFRLMTMLTLTTGTAFIMWLGEQITERGIGNGMSLIIFAGIVVGPAARGHPDVRADADRSDRASSRSSLLIVLMVGGRRARSSSSNEGSGGSRCSTPSASSAAGCTAGRARTCR